RRNGSMRPRSAVVSLLLLACLSAFSLSSSSARAATPSLAIVSPADGSIAANGTPVIVRFIVSDFMFVQPGRLGQVVAPNEGHLQMILDGSVMEELAQYEPGFLVSLPDGDHVLTMRLVNNDDTPLSPDVSASITFHVTASTSATLPLVLNGGVLFLEVFVLIILILRRRKAEVRTPLPPRDEL